MKSYRVVASLLTALYDVVEALHDLLVPEIGGKEANPLVQNGHYPPPHVLRPLRGKRGNGQFGVFLYRRVIVKVHGDDAGVAGVDWGGLHLIF